jgi:parvulin-like peptidyl-prolyl isomerase
MLPGDFYLVDEGTRGEKFDEVVFNQLKPGELVSEPIRVEDGYVVVQLAKVLPQDQWPLTRVEESIRNTLRRRKEEQLQKRLEATYFAKYNAKVLEESFLDQAE